MKTVLVIDDDRVFRSTVCRILADKGWNVLEADGGDRGLEIALEHRPAVVVSDLLMPHGNGYKVIRSIRETGGAFGKTRIIVTTASPYGTDRDTALAAGADGYLVKPLIASELFHLLDNFSSGAETGKPAGAEDGDIRSATTLVKFWGVRGSVPTPGPGTVHFGGNTSCVEVRSDDQIIVLDAGTGIRPLGGALAAESNGKPIQLTLLLTHTHWDHIQGFPFFAPAYNPKNTVRVFAYEGARKGLEATLSSQMESPYFPISLHQMPGNIAIQELKAMSFNIGSVQIEAAFANHPGICVGYRLVTRHGSIVYMPDNELFQRLKEQGTPRSVENFPEAQSFAKHQDQKLIDFMKGADILILDSQYDEAEYLKRIGWGHSCLDDSVALAVSAGVKQLYLFHHDPDHDDARISKFEVRARELVSLLGGTTRVEAAREGASVELPMPMV
ncbi:MAG: response regulator [Verrucomicrobia bacterium]|nr:response regulator [Verrucomicrobiota bacterium]